jgi:hypothetical protein
MIALVALSHHIPLSPDLLSVGDISGIPPLVLLAAPPPHEDAQDGAHGKETNDDGVAAMVVRSVLPGVCIGRENTTQVSKADLHGDAYGALG